MSQCAGKCNSSLHFTDNKSCTASCFCSFRFYDYVSFYHKAEELKLKMNDMLAVCLKWQLKDGLMESFRQIFSFSLQVI